MWLESNHIIRLQERGQERWWLEVVSPPGFVTRVIMFSRVQLHSSTTTTSIPMTRTQTRGGEERVELQTNVCEDCTIKHGETPS